MATTINTYTTSQQCNYTLQMLLASFTDPYENWFTSLAVLCIYQRHFAGKLLQKVNIANGKPPLIAIVQMELIDAIASGAKLTKADVE